MAELQLSGERFRVTYHLWGTPAEVEAVARSISIEQTVEFPRELVTDEAIRDHVFGRIELMSLVNDDVVGHYRVVISYAIEVAGVELTQLLNVIFGNISLQPSIRVERLELPPTLLEHFRGPRFGRRGLRRLVGVDDRPLLCSAIKPMGLAPEVLAGFAHSFALGGVDFIKDDHGLADQPFCRFEERVERCVDAVERGNRQTGGHCLYLPNVTAPAEQMMDRIRFAKEAGVGGLLVAPGLVGWDVMRRLADDDDIALPILAHPALMGSYIVGDKEGFSHYALFGQIMRLCGADAVIFPHQGGRFTFSGDDCRGLVKGTEVPMGNLKASFPVPAGGMSLERVPEMCRFYGTEVIFLIGGDLHRRGDLVESCREFRRRVESV
ncbi:MAG: ribulose 1,5-bisphosphate carboxylase large subunit [Proteobacteria bacterium]|jgi:ribulose-bisphosphate carboxylase large chain|nr:ribulose 1,5-bisphosphate carboxylase large subunit [Pseudomonadota bacterium]